jgi:hypothetical protein
MRCVVRVGGLFTGASGALIGSRALDSERGVSIAEWVGLNGLLCVDCEGSGASGSAGEANTGEDCLVISFLMIGLSD